MFEKEISDYVDRISKRHSSDHVKLSTILTDSELPEGFRRFAEAEVDEALDGEDFGKSKTGKFDLTSQDVQALLREIRHLLKKSYEYSQDDFVNVVIKASKFIFDFTVRPRWAIEKALFGTGQVVDKRSVEKVSRYFVAYPYYQRGVLEYMDFTGKSDIDIDSWRKVHSRIDEHLISVLPSKATTLTSSLFALFTFVSGDESIPIDAAILFFKDKQATVIVNGLEKARESKDLKWVDPITLTMILEATLGTANAAASPSPTPAPSVEITSSEISVAVETTRVPVSSAPVTNEVAGGPEQNPLHVPQPPRVEPHTVPSALSGRPKAAGPSIRSFLPEKIEIRIIKKIFNGSRSGYQVAIHRLDESPDWQTASKIVEGIFMEAEIDPFSKYAVVFTDAVSAKFRAKR